MKSNTITFSQEDLVEATKTGSKLKKYQDKQLNELIDNTPKLGYSVERRGREIEELIMKVIKKKGKTSASWLNYNMHIPVRTAGGALIRLREQRLLISEYKNIKDRGGAMRTTNVFSLAKKNGRKRNK